MFILTFDIPEGAAELREKMREHFIADLLIRHMCERREYERK